MKTASTPVSKLANHIERRVDRELEQKQETRPEPVPTLSAPVKEKSPDKGED